MRILNSMDDLAKNPSAHMKRLKGERDVPIFFSSRGGISRVVYAEYAATRHSGIKIGLERWKMCFEKDVFDECIAQY